MRNENGIHFAQYATSERLQRFLELMLDGKPRTTLEIIRGAEICAVNSAACELRMNGFEVACVQKSRPAVYQLLDVDGARELSDRLLGPREAVNG